MRASNQFADATTGGSISTPHRGGVPTCRVGVVIDPECRGEFEVDPAAGHARPVARGHQLGGSGDRRPLANALVSWSVLRFEVTEDPSPGVDGQAVLPHPARSVERGDERQR